MIRNLFVVLILVVAMQPFIGAQEPAPADVALSQIESLLSQPETAEALKAKAEALRQAVAARTEQEARLAELEEKAAAIQAEIDAIRSELNTRQEMLNGLGGEIASVKESLAAPAPELAQLQLLEALTQYIGGRVDPAPQVMEAPAAEPPSPAVESAPPVAEEPAAATALSADMADYFETSVRPVLVEHCYACHGPGKQKAGLRVDSLASLLQGGDSGPAVVQGDPEQSRLIQALTHEGDTKMPPDEKLPQEQIDALTEWVRMGAPWPGVDAASAKAGQPLTIEEQVAEARASHWAFKPVQSPALPVAADPAWNESPIDKLIFDKLAAKGLTPSPQADRATLLRRLSFDLTGLPPTMEEMDAFAADASPDAYEKQVDRLLASPAFGERWGRYWLDLARYSDTKGYVFQEERDFAFSHTYRDYVIQALNDDLPYDTFIKQQLAADQMALSDKRHLAAMGFLTLGRSFVGNVHDQIDDRIDVVTRGLMGITVSCARCHDHFFDPVPTADYYSLYGVFRSSVQPGELPLIEDPNPEDPEYQDFLKAVGEKDAEIERFTGKLHRDMLSHARDKAADYLLAGQEVQGQTDPEVVRTLARDRGLMWQLVEKWRDQIAAKAGAGGVDPVYGVWLAFAALPAEGFEEAAKALFAERMADPAFVDAINPVLKKHLADKPPTSMADLAERYRAAFAEADGAWMRELASAAQAAAIDGGAPALPTALDDAALEGIRLAMYLPDSPTSVPKGNVFDYSDVPTQGQIRNRRNEKARVENTHPGRPDRAMVLTDATPFDPYIFERGKPENRGPDVPRQAPLLLAPDRKPFEKGSGRLELAEVIASPENPLTARVYVNRVWGNLFGRFLVDTPSDFGLRCDPPTHPELLDQLASDFMADGWSTKRLIKRIVLSQAYRQASYGREDALQVDPENRLLWRQNRRRLDFEAMRDALLATAGTLDTKMGGPAVEIAGDGYAKRRTVYGRIERQNLPAMFRTFDFASPDTHSPRRWTTTVPQQALFMMNSPFVVEQARALAARPGIVDEANAEARIARLYHQTLQRDPADEEIELARQFLESADASPALDAPMWRYGYGGVDTAANTLRSFTSLPGFREGRYMGSGAEFPAPDLGWTSITATGGHPGDKPEHSTVLRWVAPAEGVVSVRGRIKHSSDQGDGVVGYVVSPGGIQWTGAAFNGRASFDLKDIAVKQGETIDFVISCGGNNGFDSYDFTPRVEFAPAGGEPKIWFARREFQEPRPEPLNPLERYAQVLLLTNEFLFVD